ncbi:MAG: recombinase family protein [Planctomycetaceae bacterium]
MARKIKVPAFGYVRVSSPGQTKGHGPERQRELIQEWADRNGFEVVGFYEDAYTGTEGDRPQFMEMLGGMMTNGTKTVIVESLDRFARDMLVQCTLLAKLAAEGLTLIAANTGDNVTAALSDDPMRKAMIQIQGVFAELDKSLLVRKLRKAREAIRAKRGRCEGVRPYGTLPGEQETAERIQKLRRRPVRGERLSYAAIAALLNDEGAATRHGGPWHASAVQNIAKRPLPG